MPNLPSRMRGLWLDHQPILRDDIPVPRPASGEALVQVSLAGVCATDLQLLRGYYPFQGILGHEFVGRIVAAPTAPQRVGERVVGEINLACGHCTLCRQGLARHCRQREVLGIRTHAGAFADYLQLPLVNLHRVPTGISDEQAVFSEPLAAAARILEQVDYRAATRCLIVGGGRLGQLIARVLAASGPPPTVVVRHRHQVDLLAGIAPTLPEGDVATDAYDLVIEATGHPSGLDTALRALRPCGTLVLKSTYAERVELDLSRLVVDEITLIGSRCGNFATALALLASGRVDPTPLISARLGLAAASEALTRAAAPGAMKILITMTGPDS